MTAPFCASLSDANITPVSSYILKSSKLSVTQVTVALTKETAHTTDALPHTSQFHQALNLFTLAQQKIKLQHYLVDGVEVTSICLGHILPTNKVYYWK